MRERPPESGRWELRVYLGRDPITRKQRSVSKIFHGGKRAAGRELADMLADHEHLQPSGALTLRVHVDEYLAGRRDLSPTTLRCYRGLLGNWVYPVLGDMRLSRLTAYEFDRLYEHMQAEGQSSSSVLSTHRMLNKALRQAVKWGRLRTNPVVNASPPARRSAMRPVPTDEEVHILLQAAVEKDEGMAALIWTAAATGARRGELAGLRWRALDLDRRVALIDAAVINTGRGRPGAKERSATTHDVVVKDTKTHAARVITLDAGVVEVLRYHRRQAERLAADFGTELGEDAFVFSRHVGGVHPVNPDTLTHDFAAIRAAAGLRPFTLHGLRHWMVGLAVGNHDVRTVAGRAGHADASMTLRVYSRFMAARDAALADEVGAALGPVPKQMLAPAELPAGA